jgi:hypothetical protein
MTPETLSRINDLRARCLQSDEARRAGDLDRAASLEPSVEEIDAALGQTRVHRTAAATPKATAAATKAKASALSSININDLFS